MVKTPFHYQPTATKVGTVVQAGLALLAIFAYVNSTHGYWLGWPPASPIHIIAMGMFACSPFVLLTMGRNYLLDGNDFVERRFDRNRRRFPLASYTGASRAFGGLLRLHFGSQRVWFHATAETERQGFLNALQERAAAARGGMPLSRIGMDGRQQSVHGVAIDHDAVRVPTARLHWGDICIACDRPGSTAVELTAKRGFDFILVKRFEVVTVRAPVCENHAKNRRNARYSLYASVLLMPIVLGVVLRLLLGGGTLAGMMFVGAFLTVFLSGSWMSFLGGDRMDWWIFGTRIKDPSPDLTTVVVQTRHPRVLHLVAHSAGADAPVRVATVSDTTA